MQKLFTITCVLLCSLMATAQLIPERYLHKDLRLHSDTSIVQITVIDDDVRMIPLKKKTYYWYQNRQIYSNKGGFAGNLLDGKYRRFDEQGLLVEEGKYNKGLKIGVWKRWNAEGELMHVSKWFRGSTYGKELNYSDEEHALIRKKKVKQPLFEKTDTSAVASDELKTADEVNSPEQENHRKNEMNETPEVKQESKNRRRR